MPRQRLAIGTFGDISTHISPTGRYVARTRYRDWDGHAVWCRPAVPAPRPQSGR